MASPTEEELGEFGNLRIPYERSDKLPELKVISPEHIVREDFDEMIYDAKDDGEPDHAKEFRRITANEIGQIDKMEFSEKRLFCYLWILDEQGLKMLWEGTINLRDQKEEKTIKHTNITEGGKAYHGGEVFFGEKIVYVNNKSDRYGHSSISEWKAVMKYFRKTYSGYEVKDMKEM